MTRPSEGRRRQLEMVRNLLAELGITPEQLVADGPTSPPSPTFNEYVPRLSEAVSPGSRRAYGPYWDRVCERWGDRCITDPTPLEIKQLSEAARGSALVRRNSRGGRTAAEHLISALRCLYRHAVMDGLISDADNPAVKVAKPRRLASTRRALSDPQMSEIRDAAASTGNDPELDCLLLRLHAETACRRGGALALLAPIPPATVSFAAVATIHSGESLYRIPALAKLVPPERWASCVIVDVRPTGHYITYGLGVPLLRMRDPSRSRARVPAD